LRYALEGGKRIRPLLLLLAAEAVGHSDDEKVLDAAVAVELLHAESIIHDDIIDEEASRRGKAAFHVKYGYSTSLLTADFVFAMILAIAVDTLTEGRDHHQQRSHEYVRGRICGADD